MPGRRTDLPSGGPTGVVNPAQQRATFAEAPAAATAAGFIGIRVAADNTPLGAFYLRFLKN